jgi:hypothetical protein
MSINSEASVNLRTYRFILSEVLIKVGHLYYDLRVCVQYAHRHETSVILGSTPSIPKKNVTVGCAMVKLLTIFIENINNICIFK